MKPISDPAKRKFVVVSIAALVSFFGLEAISEAIVSNQVGHFLKVSLYVYLFLVFWVSFIFDLKLKDAYRWDRLENTFLQAVKKRFAYMFEKHHFLHFQNYLILPGIIYWCTVVLIYLNPFEYLPKQALIISATLALTVAFWYLKTVFYGHHEEGKRNPRQLLFLTKIYASYVAFAAAFGVCRYFGFDTLFFGLAVFSITYLLFHQALFQHHYVGFESVQYILAASLVLAEAAVIIFSVWNVNYLSGALAITAVYNTAWGYMQHKYIDKDLSREIMYEYLAMLFVVLVILFNTTNFSERIY